MRVSCYNQKGFSLIELMISMLLGLLLLAGLVTVYVNNQKSYQLTQALAHMQEDGRIVMQIMAHDIRMVGYVGCGRLAEIALHANNFNAKNSLAGWRDGRSSATMLLPILSKTIKPKTDVLLLQKADDYTVAVKSTTNSAIHFAEKHTFSAEDLLLISDCQKADVVHFKQPHFPTPYQMSAQASRWQKIIYYVAETPYRIKKHTTVYALYRRDLNASPYLQNELIDGVEDLQILYGERSINDKQVSYVDAATVKNWQMVYSVQINLLLVSKTAVLDQPQTYVFQNKVIQAKDRRLYRVFQTVVALRERLR